MKELPTLETLTWRALSDARRLHPERFGGNMQKRLEVGFAVACLLILLSLGAQVAPAQAVTGTLLGTVQDSLGAVVPDANVTLTNEGTDVINKASSSLQGFYTFPNLDPGEYTVTVVAKGFKTLTSKHNAVLVEQSTRVDLALSPGAVSEQVTVTGQTPMVETTTSDLGTTIDSTQINNLPINGRSPNMLMQLAPGSTPAAWGAGNGEDSSTASTTAPGGGGGGAYTSTNGFPFESNLYLVDGVSDVELENSYQGLQMPFDFIGELKLETSDPSAEYGAFGAQVSNITTKTGSNAFHGQVFEFNRNTDFNEPDHFSKTNPPFHYNQFGGEVDGPIIKNKLFFAADLQWLKLAEGSSGVVSLPTAAARGGDLSAFDANGKGPLTNPMACYYSALANGLPSPVPCTASAAIAGSGTADTVPAADIVPIAANFFNSSVWPLPNLSGQTNNATQVVLNDASEPQEDARVDYALSQSDRIFARFGYSVRHLRQPAYVGTDTSPNPFMNAGNINATNQTTNNVLGWNHTFGSKGTLMNELRLGYSRFATTDFTPDYGISENNILGVPNGNLASYPETSGVAEVSINGFEGTGNQGWVPDTLGRLSNIYQINDAFTVVKGRNNWKFGVSINPIQARVYNSQNDPRGQFCAYGNYTGAGTNGSAIADWLVGALGNGGNCQGAAVARDHFFDHPNTRTKQIGEFAQDDLRVNSKLTLNLGFRYDVYTHPVDTNNLQSNFVTTGPNAGLIQVASSSNRGPNVNTYYGNIGPRVGVAYTPDNGKTAIRGAFGVSYFNGNFGADGGTLERNFPELDMENNAAPLNNCSTPYTGAQGNINPNPAEYSSCGSLILANGLPGNSTSGTPVYTPLVPFSVAPGGTIASPQGFGVYEVASNFRPSQADNWNVSIERSLGANTSLRAAYVGTKGAYLYNDWQLNQCNPTSFTQGPTYAELQAQYGTTVYPNFPECTPYYSIAPGVSTLDFRNSGAKSHYNAGELVLERRTGANLTFTAGYTWSKLMDNYSNQLDSYDMKEYLDTVGWHHNNFPQTLTLTYVYTLPFGRGQKLANSVSPVEDAIVGGWTISGVTWFRSGAPLLITASGQYLLGQNGGQRANYTCSVAVNPHTTSEWFDTGCFSQPVGFVFGDDGVGQGNGYGPRYQSWDMSFGKAVHLAEHMRLQFQAQFFNIFNRVNYQQPDTGVTDSSFGQITNDFLPRQGQLGMVLTF
jgi:Carboxypeptidase regulatory-like domain